MSGAGDLPTRWSGLATDLIGVARHIAARRVAISGKDMFTPRKKSPTILRPSPVSAAIRSALDPSHTPMTTTTSAVNPKPAYIRVRPI